jgi:hypothetical protein
MTATMTTPEMEAAILEERQRMSQEMYADSPDYELRAIGTEFANIELARRAADPSGSAKAEVRRIQRLDIAGRRAGTATAPTPAKPPAATPTKSRPSDPVSLADYRAARLAYNSDPALQQQHGSFDSYWRASCNLPDSPATAAKKADADARVKAGEEWDAKSPDCKHFSAKENYVNYRVAEIGGRLRTARQR